MAFRLARGQILRMFNQGRFLPFKLENNRIPRFISLWLKNNQNQI